MAADPLFPVRVSARCGEPSAPAGDNVALGVGHEHPVEPLVRVDPITQSC
jgi:hypothetical protein